MGEIVVGVEVAAACVYGTSAVSKLCSVRAYRSFRAGFGRTELAHRRLLPVVAAILAIGEAASAALLTTAVVTIALSGSAGRSLSASALAVCWVLTAVLVAGVVKVISRGTAVRCACFGASSETGPPLGTAHLVRNACLLALVTAGLTDILLADPPAGQGVLLGGCVAAAAGIVCALFLIRWEDIAYLVAPAAVAGPASHERARAAGRR
jgi:hypothetical protein